jgi:hypothetical protein
MRPTSWNLPWLVENSALLGNNIRRISKILWKTKHSKDVSENNGRRTRYRKCQFCVVSKKIRNTPKSQIKDDAIIAAVELSQRYITNRFLPDKAIDLMDEAASNTHGNQF